MATLNEGPYNGQPRLPPGFRFHPTDEELVSFYLAQKYQNPDFTAAPVISEADVNKCEPWDLPGELNLGEKRYFYSMHDRKYPTGMRVNRATNTGYWKATGKDREIRNSRNACLLGMRKTLVFYKGRAPRGQKTAWIMHEYRRESPLHFNSILSKDEWVICRIFRNDARGKGRSLEYRRRPTFVGGLRRSESGEDPQNQKKTLQRRELVQYQLAASKSQTARCSDGSAVHSHRYLAPAPSLHTAGATSNCADLLPPLWRLRMPLSSAASKAVRGQFLEESAHSENEASCRRKPVSSPEYVGLDDLLDLPTGQPLEYDVTNSLNNTGSQQPADQSSSLQPQAIDHPCLMSPNLCEKTYHPAVFNGQDWCWSNGLSSTDLESLWRY